MTCTARENPGTGIGESGIDVMGQMPVAIAMQQLNGNASVTAIEAKIATARVTGIKTVETVLHGGVGMTGIVSTPGPPNALTAGLGKPTQEQRQMIQNGGVSKA